MLKHGSVVVVVEGDTVIRWHISVNYTTQFDVVVSRHCPAKYHYINGRSVATIMRR